MLECVLRLRVERLLVDELAGSQLAERFGELSLGQLRHALQHRLGKLLSDDGRRLQEMLLTALQAVDPSREHGLNGGWNGDLIYLPDQPIVSPDSDETPILGQSLTVLLDEEGVSSRHLEDMIGLVLHISVCSEK